MTDPSVTDEWSMGRTTEDRVDRLCDQFETEWKAAARPRIEDYLADAPLPERPRLFQELVEVELEYRTRRYERPTIGEYRQRFPEYVDLIDTLFPSLIGPYRVLRRLGEGGFGAVYLADDEDLQRQVAVKVPRNDRFPSPQDLERFLNDARTAARLSHPAIVTLYHVGRSADGTSFIVMEYIDGPSLAELLQHERMLPDRAAALVAQVAEAVHYAHKRGFVHRDLKPGNILLQRCESEGRGSAVHRGARTDSTLAACSAGSFVPKITDFGLAVHEDIQRLQAGEVAGTPAYMAPEQVRGETHRLDGRTDIWSLGVILYELLTGRLPFAGRNWQELSDEILDREPKPPRQMDDTIPAALEKTCLKCLSKPIDGRYTTAADLADELRTCSPGRAGGYTPRDLQTELAQLRQELIDEGQRRRALPREPIVGLRFMDVNEFFHGRATELAQLRRLLTDPAVKLTSIVGRPGVGKTALLSKLCSEVERGELRLTAQTSTLGADGIIYIAGRGTDTLTVERLFRDVGRILGGASARELWDCWGDPSRSLVDKTGVLLSKLRHGSYLLVVDNLDHALAADNTLESGDLSTFLEMCLATPHGMRLLAASRARPVVTGAGRQMVRVLSLESGLSMADAVAVLRGLDPDEDLGLANAPQQLLEDAAQRCHGIPRALESIASMLSRDPSLTLADLLRDSRLFTEQVVVSLALERHRQATPAQRRVLDSLAVYDRPVPAAAVRNLVEPYCPKVSVQDILHELVRNYSVSHDRARATYHLHPIDQEHIYSGIPDDASEYCRRVLHRRAAGFFAALRKPHGEWKAITDVQPQVDEIEQLIRAGDHDSACRVLDRLDFGYLALWGESELIISLRSRLAEHLKSPRLRHMNWYQLGLAHNRLWCAEDAIRCFEKAIAAQGVGREMRNAIVQGNLGRALLLVGRTEDAIHAFEETINTMRRLGNRLGESLWTGRLGEARQRLGRTEDALACYQEASSLSRLLADRRWQVTHLSNAGDAFRELGDLEAAQRCLVEALQLARATANRQGEQFCFTRLAQLLHDAGELDRARDYYERALQIGLPPCNFICCVQLGLLDLARGTSHTGYFARAISFCGELLRRTPRLYDARYALGAAQLASGQQREALDTYRHALTTCAAAGIVRRAMADLRRLQLVAPSLPGLADVRLLLPNGTQLAGS
jgi:serine/threonine protein kinase/tetratricopeptide (TPR) repeat protein